MRSHSAWGQYRKSAGSWFHLDREDQYVIIMCGMSARFFCRFPELPWLPPFFSGGRQRRDHVLTALLPHVISSLIAAKICRRHRYTRKASMYMYPGADRFYQLKNYSCGCGLPDCPVL